MNEELIIPPYSQQTSQAVSEIGCSFVGPRGSVLASVGNILSSDPAFLICATCIFLPFRLTLLLLRRKLRDLSISQSPTNRRRNAFRLWILAHQDVKRNDSSHLVMLVGHLKLDVYRSLKAVKLAKGDNHYHSIVEVCS